MERTVLRDITFTVDTPYLLSALHLTADGDDAGAICSLVREAEALARPKALYRVAWVDSKADDHVVVDGVRLTSRVLRVNLDNVQRVFAYVATAGMELEEWAESKTDILERYWADGIMLQALRSAMSHLAGHLQDRYRSGALSRMNPGSLADWPLREQRPLFDIIGDVQPSIDVRLTDSFLMVPRKSVSGIQFPTEESFESCQLCGRESCPNRRAPFDPALFDQKYRQTQ